MASLDDFDQGVVRRTIDRMYLLKKVLSTLDDIRTDLQQNIGYTGSKDRLRKNLLHMKLSYTRCGGKSENADGAIGCSP